ncbi:hypothetical protein HK405_009633, partial [Cladochytrium tenue]
NGSDESVPQPASNTARLTSGRASTAQPSLCLPEPQRRKIPGPPLTPRPASLPPLPVHPAATEPMQLPENSSAGHTQKYPVTERPASLPPTLERHHDRSASVKVSSEQGAAEGTPL